LESLPFHAIGARIGDVDGDGIGDLIGNNGDLLLLRLGAVEDPLQESRTFGISQPTGQVIYGELTEDGLLDVIIPTAQGLLNLLGHTDQTLEPVAYSSQDLGNPLVDLFAINMIGLWQVPILVDGTAKCIFPLLNDESACGDLLFPPGATINRLTPVAIGNYDGDADDEFVLAFTNQTTVELVDPVVTQLNHETRAIPPDCIINGGTLFADYDGDGDLDLLVFMLCAGTPEVALARNVNGVLGTISTLPASPLKGFERPRAAVNLSLNSRADYVFVDKIMIADGPTEIGDPTDLFPVVETPPGRIWSDVAIGDFNGDAHIDAVFSTYDDTADVLLGSGFGLFNLFQVNTGFPIKNTGIPSRALPGNLTAMDYDGDYLSDIGFVRTNGDTGLDEFVVAFSNDNGRFSDPISMGSAASIGRLAPIRALSPLEVDLVSDALVLSSSPESLASVALFQGNPSRRLTAPFVLNAGDGSITPKVVMVGHFVGPTDGEPDIMALSVPESVDNAQSWLITGHGDGGGLVPSPLILSNAYHIVACEHWVTADFDGDGWDEGLGIEQCGNDGETFWRRLSLTPTPAGATLDIIDPQSEFLFRRTLSRFDAEPGQPPHALVVFQDGTANFQIGMFRNQGGSLGLAPEALLPAEADRNPLAAAPILLNDDVYPDIVYVAVLTDDADSANGLATNEVRVLPSLGPLEYGPPTTLAVIPESHSLITGDVNGDGLDDVAVFSGVANPRVHLLLSVPGAPIGGP
jgi:hypothetical protein